LVIYQESFTKQCTCRNILGLKFEVKSDELIHFFRVLQVVLAPSRSQVPHDFSVAMAVLADHSAHLAVCRRNCHSRRKIRLL